MTDYKRMVSYMYQYENGIKRKNVGYVRIETKNGQCKFTIHMQLLGQSDSIFPTYVIHRHDNTLDLIYLGDSILKTQLMDSKLITSEDNIMESGYGLKDMSGILIFMNNNIFLATVWDDKALDHEELLEAMRPKNRRYVRNEKQDSYLEAATYNTNSTVKNYTADQKEIIKAKIEASVNEIKNEKPIEEEQSSDEIVVSMKRSQDNIVSSEPQIQKDSDVLSSENTDSNIVLNPDNTISKEEADIIKELSAEIQKLKEMIEKEAKSYEEKLSLEEELKMPTYKFPRGLKTIEVFRRSAAIADKLYAADNTSNIEQMRSVEESSNLTTENTDQDSQIEVGAAEDTSTIQDISQDADVESDTNQANFDMDSIFTRFSRLYPFEDNEILLCVKIEPKDIGLLPKELWSLSNNSFLLHGYYCYHHLILAKMKYKDKEIYILGVPGLYHSREQFMARMFGFTNFKSIKKRELRKSDFGYWYLQIPC